MNTNWYIEEIKGTTIPQFRCVRHPNEYQTHYSNAFDSREKAQAFIDKWKMLDREEQIIQ